MPRWTLRFGNQLGRIAVGAGAPVDSQNPTRRSLAQTSVALARIAHHAGGPTPKPVPQASFRYVITPALGLTRVGGPPQRFELLRRTHRHGELVSEERLDLDHVEVAALEWKVHVRNIKAVSQRVDSQSSTGQPGARERNWARRNQVDGYQRLILDPGVKAIAGRSRRRPLARFDQAVMPAGFRGPADAGITSLGEIATDGSGNLEVFAGPGQLASDAETGRAQHDEDDRFDDLYDGWIAGRLTLRSGAKVAFRTIDSAWVVSARARVGPGPSLFERLRSVASGEELDSLDAATCAALERGSASDVSPALLDGGWFRRESGLDLRLDPSRVEPGELTAHTALL